MDEYKKMEDTDEKRRDTIGQSSIFDEEEQKREEFRHTISYILDAIDLITEEEKRIFDL